jgi:DinB superfamily
MHDLVVRDLGRARDRTLGLTDVDEPTLVAQHDPLMSPLVWDLAHVGQQEELWLLRGGDQARPGMLRFRRMWTRYTTRSSTPRAERLSLPPGARGSPRPPGPPAGPPSYPNSKIKIHYVEPPPPRPATGQRERSGLGGQVV